MKLSTSLLSFRSKKIIASSNKLLRRFICGMTTQLQDRDQRLLPCPLSAQGTIRTARACRVLSIIIIIFAQQFFCYPIVLAGNFGIHGHTFPISEEDILKVIEARLEKIDLEKLNKELREKTEKYAANPPSVKGIAKATELKITYYDPTFVNPEDILDHNGLLIAPKGKTVNPLAFTSLTQPLIFINGDDEEQVNYAITQANAKIILVKGSPLKLQRKHKRWIYFDQAGVITSKLGITEVPALVEQEGLRLRVTVGGANE